MNNQRWLTSDETEFLTPVSGSYGALAVDVHDRYFASDETYGNFFGPFRTREEAKQWQKGYAESL